MAEARRRRPPRNRKKKKIFDLPADLPYPKNAAYIQPQWCKNIVRCDGKIEQICGEGPTKSKYTFAISTIKPLFQIFEV